ncbi:MAG: BON domain-containing protein [Thiohalorhabdus sp.]|uniref:BON domain-containing protein n=1 Tax=Thiohalorhabdus sp. TaxID=3094134 RepID=UPI003980FD0F
MRWKHGLAMALLVPLLAGPAGAAGEGADNEADDGIGKELGELAREIEEQTRRQGRYLGEKLGEWTEEGGSWAEDRALQARVKTTLSGVLGAASLTAVDVDVTEGVVTLRGELTDWEQVARAVRAVEQIDGVRRVVSELTAPGSV